MQGLLELKEQCLHPATNKPYLKSLRAGKDNSPEGWQVLPSLLYLCTPSLLTATIINES